MMREYAYLHDTQRQNNVIYIQIKKLLAIFISHIFISMGIFIRMFECVFGEGSVRAVKAY